MKKIAAVCLSLLMLFALLPFSVMAEGESSSVKLAFYEGDNLLSEQELQSGNPTVLLPEVAASRSAEEEKTEYFAGWYDENGALFDFSRAALLKLTESAEGELTLNLYAVYRDSFVVYFLLEGEAECTLISTAAAEPGATVTPPATVTVGGEAKTPTLWYTDRGTGLNAFGESSPVSSDLLVYTKFEKENTEKQEESGEKKETQEEKTEELPSSPESLPPITQAAPPLTLAGDNHTVTVTVVGAGVANPMERSVSDGQNLTIMFSASTGYALDSVVATLGGNSENLSFAGNTSTLKNITEDITVTVTFGIDRNKDGIPDSRQRTVTYVIYGGTFGDPAESGAVDQRVKYFTFQQLGTDGVWTDLETPKLGDSIPTDMHNDDTHSGDGSWVETFDAETPVTENVIYHYSYSPVLTYRILQDTELIETQLPNPGKFRVDPNGGSFENTSGVSEMEIVEDTFLEEPTRKDYVFWGWVYDESTNTFTAQWEVDQVGLETSNFKPGSDGIPDRYQKQVVYRIVNGVWADRITIDRVYYLTLRDQNGKLSETGSASAADIIPKGMTPAYGYVDTNAKWDVEPKTTETGTAAVVYTYSFVTHTENPSTGDHTDGALWLGLMCFSALGVGSSVTVLLKQKKKLN